MISCGQCGMCVERKQKEWRFRLHWETKRSLSAFFITLTYNDWKAPQQENGILTVQKRDIQTFMKRIRRRRETLVKNGDIPLHFDKKSPIRYYMSSEYGPKTGRPHYHGIIWNLTEKEAREDKLLDVWNSGMVTVTPANPARIGYVTKYLHMKYDPNKPEIPREPEFQLMSQKPYIGSNYVEKNAKMHRDNNIYHARMDGFLVPLPKLFIDKIWPTQIQRDMVSLALEENGREQMIKDEKKYIERGLDPEKESYFANHAKEASIRKQAKRSYDKL